LFLNYSEASGAYATALLHLQPCVLHVPDLRECCDSAANKQTVVKHSKMLFPMPFSYQKHCLHAVVLIGLAFALCAADSPGSQFTAENAESVAANDADIDFLSESPAVPDDVTIDVDTQQKRGEWRELWTKGWAYLKSWVTKDEEFKLPGSVLASWKDSGCRTTRQKRTNFLPNYLCNDDCIVVVNTQEAKVNPLTQNGLVDITAQLQGAVEKASVAATRRGIPTCTVMLPKGGQYTISKTISVRSRVHVMGNSATITLPQRSSLVPYFPAFEFKGQGTADVPLFTFSTPPSKPIGPGQQIDLPSNVASAAAQLLARKERVVLRAYLLGVPDMQQFLDTQHKILYENYADVVNPNSKGEWAKNPIGFLVEVLSVSSSNVAQLRSSLPFKFHRSPFAMQMIPASNFVANSALTDLFLVRPSVSPSDIKIIQANYCEGDSSQCKAIKDENAAMHLQEAIMVVMRYTLDVQISRNSMTGIIRSGTWMDNTLHACFHDNIVTNAHLFGDTGPGFGNGVTLSEYSSYNSVSRNSFSTLRHAMLLQFGANSNVVANNKNNRVRCQMCRPSPMSHASAQSKVDELVAKLKQVQKVTLGIVDLATPLERSWGKVIIHDLSLIASEPAVSTACANLQHDDSSKQFSLLGQNIDWCADISFHGLFSNNNLVEGNDVESIKIADYYGPSPSNVVFGNRINAGTLSVVVDRASTDTMLVDNLFTHGGISFLDDASSVTCIDNKKGSWQPPISEFSVFSTPCTLLNAFSATLNTFVKSHTKVGKFTKWITDGCAYWDKNTGGKENKFDCIHDNIISVKARPESLFADKTQKACTQLKNACFDGMQGPVSKRFCYIQSPSPAPPTVSELESSPLDEDQYIDAELTDANDGDDDVDVELDSALYEDGSDGVKVSDSAATN